MFEFKFNNFLHTQVTNIIKFVFNSLPAEVITDSEPAPTSEEPNDEETTNQPLILVEHLLNDCKLVQRLVDKWTEYFRLVETETEKKSTYYRFFFSK